MCDFFQEVFRMIKKYPLCSFCYNVISLIQHVLKVSQILFFNIFTYFRRKLFLQNNSFYLNAADCCLKCMNNVTWYILEFLKELIFPSIFCCFLLSKCVFQALRVTVFVIFWSRGTDESFLNTCVNDFRFFRQDATLSEKISGQRLPSLFSKFLAWKKRFASLKLFGNMRLL